MATPNPRQQQSTLVVLVEDQPGVLTRVVSMMRRRSFNIDSITVGHSEQPGVSRITMVVSAPEDQVEQIAKQLYKVIEVLKVTDVTHVPTVSRELALIKVAAKPQYRSEIMQIAEIYEARIVDATPTSLLVEATGAESKIDALIAMLRGYGIREMVRSGQLAMARGSAVASVPETAGSNGRSRDQRILAAAANGASN
ncbi:MAG TPA: acetolactate synthase small subunit [Thermomicrobiales bacterium]|jgi:acetolactate synthase-1/3 small subunit|nr:acetolactate synthase small subunit [Thermomicrobiales bacterium]